MPTEPFRLLLDRAEAISGARKLIEIVSPVLQEIVNYSTAALRRCEGEMAPTPDSEDVHIAPFILFRHSIELTDAIQVLLSRSCVEPAIPILRSSFETTLGLRYIFETGNDEDVKHRSLSWLCGDTHERMRYLDTIQQRNMSAELSDAISDEAVAEARQLHQQLEAFLQRPHMQEVEARYQAHSRNWPNWYSLFRGPNDLRSLAEHLDWKDYYDLLYRQWSSDAHATGSVTKVFGMAEGRLLVDPIRYPKNMLQVAAFTEAFHMYAITAITRRYRPGEEEHRRKWYTTEIAPVMERIQKTTVEIDAKPHEGW